MVAAIDREARPGRARNLSQLCVVALALLPLTCASAEEAIAILDLKFIEDTGEPAVYLCFDGEDCAVWGSYYLFEAHVTELISGELPDQPFKVIFGRHALRQIDFDDVIAILVPREDAAPEEPAYRIRDLGHRRDIYCIARPRDDDVDVDSDIESPPFEELNCYDPESWNE